MGVDGQDRRRHVRRPALATAYRLGSPGAGRASPRRAEHVDPLLVDVGMGDQADQPGANRPGQHALLSPIARSRASGSGWKKMTILVATVLGSTPASGQRSATAAARRRARS